MTTIIIHQDHIAADSKVTRGSLIDNVKCTKLLRVADGILGCAGSLHDMRILQSYMLGALEGFPDDLNCEGLFLPDKGKPYTISIERGIMITEYVSQPAAIGSGGAYSIAAARAGASAREAVKIACTLDVYSGGAIKVMKRGDKK